MMSKSRLNALQRTVDTFSVSILGVSCFALLHVQEFMIPSLSTSEQHIFLRLVGLKCAQSILESDESACLICENLLTKR